MKKSFIIMFILMGLCLFVSSEVFAVDLPASAIVPGPSAIDPSVLSVIPNASNPKLWESYTDVTRTGKLEFTTSLPGEVLRLKTFIDDTDPDNIKTYNIFLPDNYFSIDVGYVWAGAPYVAKITVEFLLPTDGSPSLGDRATATFMGKSRKADGSEKEEEKGDAIGDGKYLLTSLNEQVDLTDDLDGKWLRLYVGIVAMDPDADFLDEDVSGAVPFVPGDAPGTYTGTLTITAGY